MATRTVRTTCPYCGVGCGVLAETDGQTLIAVQGDPEHPANHGRLCVKGTALPETQVDAGRLTHPQVDGRRASWEQALDRVARGFQAVIDQHGPDAVAFYLSGQLLTEDYYVANKLMKGFIGSANVDTNSRLCMASAVAAHKRAFGEDVVPCSYEDLDACELIVLVGSNAAWTHPVLYQRIAARQARGELKVVVIDPRQTATCEIADLHLMIRPGMDAALFNALLLALRDRDTLNTRFIDQHTTGFGEALEAAVPDAARTAQLTGLSSADLETFFDWFASTERTITFFSQGVNQASNGTDKANAIINAHLATGRIGRRGAGPFSITGQPNAMGGREVGGMANQLAAHQDFSPASIEAVGRFWQAPNMVTGPGLKAVEMFQAVARGEIKAIWIMGTNPAVSLPDSTAVGEALDACPLVVVSDCVAETETTALADILLPAQGWGEKDGTVTNSERRLSRQRGFLQAVGEAKPDWWIVSQVAARLGYADAFGYGNAAQIFREHVALTGSATPERQLDLSIHQQLSDKDYDELAPYQWGGSAPFANRRFRTDSGRARLIPVAPHEPRQRVSDNYPFVLNTGRLRDQWHTMTRTGTAPRLLGHTDRPLIDMHPEDAQLLGLNDGDLVRVSNQLGDLTGLLKLSQEVQPGTLFAAIHWNGRMAAASKVSTVVKAATDPISGQPESKHAIATVAAIPAIAWCRWVHRQAPGGPTLPIPESLFSISQPSRGGTRIEIALAAPQDAGELARSLAGENVDPNVLTLVEPRTTQWLLEGADGLIAAGAIAGQRVDLPDWRTLESRIEGNPSWALLAATPTAPQSRQVCACFEIREATITEAIEQGASTLADLQSRLRCGTNCGSCIPEIDRLLTLRSAAHPQTGTQQRSEAHFAQPVS